MSADLPKPVEIDWPEYNAHAMGCGLEDRYIMNRYEAMAYGWNEAIDRARERVPEEPFTEAQLREYAEAKCAELRAVVAQMAEALNYAREEIANLQAHFDPITFPHQYVVGKIDDALSAYQSLGEQSAREPRQ